MEITPWFNPALFGWLPGTLFGCLGGLYGALAGILAPRGKARTLVIGLHWLLTATALLFLAAGIVALFLKQPYGVWYALLLPGVLGVVLFPSLSPVIGNRYAEAELRKSRAADL